jgi:hypothetical protein
LHIILLVHQEPRNTIKIREGENIWKLIWDKQNTQKVKLLWGFLNAIEEIVEIRGYIA